MTDDVTKAYEALVPRDQVIIDVMIISLYEKDVEIMKIARAAQEANDAAATE